MPRGGFGLTSCLYSSIARELERPLKNFWTSPKPDFVGRVTLQVREPKSPRVSPKTMDACEDVKPQTLPTPNPKRKEFSLPHAGTEDVSNIDSSVLERSTVALVDRLSSESMRTG
jgi:hypothetical protein